jgi:hypothetical protein
MDSLQMLASDASQNGGIIPLDDLWAKGTVGPMEYVIKETHFELLTEVQKTDAKKRLSLGSAVEEAGSVYNIYRNRLGQIMLDPVKAVPAYETWLFDNKAALASLKRGLEDSAAGRTKNLGSFAEHAKE